MAYAVNPPHAEEYDEHDYNTEQPREQHRRKNQKPYNDKKPDHESNPLS